MDLVIFWALFVVLGITYFAIALGASRNIYTEQQFFFADRKVGVFAIAMTLAATHIGGGVVLGGADEAYNYGLFAIYYSMGIVAAFIILAGGLAVKIRRLDIKTTAEIFAKKYHSKVLRKIASIISVITLGGVLAGQIVASRKIMEGLLGEYNFLLVLFWLLVILYTMIGGLKAVIATDIFQMAVIFIIMAGIAALLFYNDQINLIDPIDTIKTFAKSPWTGPEGQKYYWLIFLMPLMYALFAQDINQRIYASRSSAVASMAIFFAAILVFLFAFLPVFFGVEAKVLGVSAGPVSSVFLTVLKGSLEPFFYYLFICAVIAAISSTADSLLCAVASNIVEDFALSDQANPVDKHVGMLVSRMATLLVGLVSLGIAFYVDDIFAILTESYQFSVSALFVSMFFALFLRAPKYEAALLSVIFGTLSFFVFRLLDLGFPKEISCLTVSLFAYAVGHFYGSFKESPIQ